MVVRKKKKTEKPKKEELAVKKEVKATAPITAKLPPQNVVFPKRIAPVVHKVAAGGSLLLNGKLLGEGSPVEASDLGGGQEALDKLIKDGVVK